MKLTTRSAALCTFLVPGLAHFLLGRPLRGVIAFASCVGLFVAGYAILQDRIWFVEMITPGETGLSSWLRLLPITLLPESPNFGCSVIAGLMREADTPDLLRQLRMPRDYEHLGFLLTGSSGILACLWAADAHWLAGERRASLPPAWAAALSWIMPGAGHVAAGQKSKGMVMGAAVWIMFLLGLIFSSGHAVDRAHYAAWWVGQSFCGGPLILSSLLTGDMKFSEFPAYMDLGVALCTVAGFMNVIVMVDAYTVAEESDVVRSDVLTSDAEGVSK